MVVVVSNELYCLDIAQSELVQLRWDVHVHCTYVLCTVYIHVYIHVHVDVYTCIYYTCTIINMYTCIYMYLYIVVHLR